MLDVGARPLLDLLQLTMTHVECHPWGHAAVVTHSAEPVAAFVSTAWGTAPATAWRQALRVSAGARVPWALLFGGDTLTLVDATRPWSRRVLTFDFPVACRQPGALLLLSRLTSGSSLKGGATSELAGAIASSDNATIAVCASLGRGVLEALESLIRELGSAEARSRGGPGPWPIGWPSTSRSPSCIACSSSSSPKRASWCRCGIACTVTRTASRPSAIGCWPIPGRAASGAALQAMARLAHLGCHADDLRVTAFNGRLFAPARTPLAEWRQLPDRAAADAVLALGTSSSRRGRRRIDFHDLGVEQLGAVYERVLEYEPVRVGSERSRCVRPPPSARPPAASTRPAR